MIKFQAPASVYLYFEIITVISIHLHLLLFQDVSARHFNSNKRACISVYRHSWTGLAGRSPLTTAGIRFVRRLFTSQFAALNALSISALLAGIAKIHFARLESTGKSNFLSFYLCIPFVSMLHFFLSFFPWCEFLYFQQNHSPALYLQTTDDP